MKYLNPEFINYASERAVKTFAQSGMAFIGGASVGLFSVDWIGFFSVAAGAAVLSILTSIVTKK